MMNTTVCDSRNFNETINEAIKYPILSQCEDFVILKQYCTEGQLEQYESDLRQYLDMSDAEIEDTGDSVPRIACWYEGLETTEDFLEL